MWRRKETYVDLRTFPRPGQSMEFTIPNFKLISVTIKNKK